MSDLVLRRNHVRMRRHRGRNGRNSKPALSVVAFPVVAVLEGVAASLFVAAMAMKYARSKLAKTLKKQNEIRVLGESKLNSIGNHVSKAIEDGCISQEEFALISEERAKYSEMKENSARRQSHSR